MPAFKADAVNADFYTSLCGTHEVPKICSFANNQPEDQIKAWLQDHSMLVVVGALVVIAICFHACVVYKGFRGASTDLEAGIPLEMSPYPKTAPANPAVVNALPVHTITEGEGECVICCEDFRAGHQVMALPCQHRFHAGCIKPWVAQVGQCPMCREELPLYLG